MEAQPVSPKGVLVTLVTFVVAALVVIGLIFGAMATYRKYSIWSREQKGKAALAEAISSKKVAVEEAKANLASEKLNAQAEVERAKGAAAAIEIENGKLTDTYIRYLWVRQQSNLNEKTVVYIPTEGGLPLLEAGKR